MTLWAPLPDELLPGYVLRLLQSNLLGNQGMLAEKLGLPGSQASGLRGAGLVRVLANALGRTPEEVLISHSLVPLLYFTVNIERRAQTRPNFSDDAYLDRSMLCPLQLRLCPECAARDRAEKFFYWRRSHQLHGVTWCRVHRRPLAEVARPDASRHGISTLLHRCAVEMAQDDLKRTLASPGVQRYEQVSRLILERCRQPVHARFGSRTIRDQAKSRGLRVNPVVGPPWGPWDPYSTGGKQAASKAGKPYLSDEAMTALPRKWFAKHFPGSLAKRPREYSSWLDDAGRPRSRPVPAATRALALALLWDDPSEAVDSFMRRAAALEAASRRSS